jgi:tetratricopeptide (TPR) repeat protein
LSSRFLAVVVFLVGLLALAPACSRDAAKAADQYVVRGDALAAQQKYKEAILEYRNAEQNAPRRGDIRKKLLELYVRTGNTSAAFRESLAAADLLPNDFDVQLTAASMNLAARRFEDAKMRADKALALNPRSVGALVTRGNALAGLKDVSGAIDDIQQAIRLDPERTLTYRDLAGLEVAQGNLPKAEETFKEAITLAPKALEPRLALANFYWVSRRPAEAESAIKEAVALHPNEMRAQQAISYLYLSLGRINEAEGPLKTVVASGADDSAALVLAQLYLSTGRTTEAIGVLDTLATRPNMAAVALSRKAAVLFGTGRKTEAYAIVQSVLDKSPKDSVALLTKAQFLAFDHDLAQALTLAQASAAADPNSVGAQFIMARLHSDRGEIEQAMACYKEALRLSPRFIAAKLDRAKLNLTQGHPAEAMTDAQDVLTIQPRNAMATLIRARAFLEEGNPDGAEPLLKTLAASFPDDGDIQAQLGNLYVRRNDRAAARASFERSLKTTPANIDALTGLAVLDFADKAGERARTRIEGVLAQPNHESAPLLILAGRTYSALGDLPRAERSLRRATELDPNSIDAMLLLGQAYSLENRLDDAISEFKTLAQKKPRAVGPPSQIGIFLELKNNRADAAKWYEQALAIDSKAPVAANNLAMFYADTGGNLDVALQLAQTAKAGLPNQPQVNDTLGWVYYKKGLASLAVGPLQESLSKDPTNIEYMAHLGMAYAKSGQPDRARGYLSKALAHGANFADAKEAQTVLAGLPKG